MSRSSYLRDFSQHGHLEKDSHKIMDTKLIFPGVRGEIKKNLNINEGVELKAGTTATIQPLNRNQPDELQKFIITPYKDKKK